ncbi:MAG TPA: class I SAM-dependent methyltransferase [Acidimicrobiia bacterium]|nr:class I SAM-dependent methyltransferase [Acidimicrobiia bacterium]
MTARYDSHRYALINRWNPRNLDLVLDWVGPPPGSRILDVGCGRGHLVRALTERGFDAWGIDLNPNARELAGELNVRTMSAAALEFGDASFDAIVSFHAIEHIPPLEQAVLEVARVVKPGGKVLFVYPAEPIRGLYAIPTSVILHRTPFKAREVHVHRLSPSKVRALGKAAGLQELRHTFRPWPSPEYASLLERQNSMLVI